MYFKWFVHDTPPLAQSEVITVSQSFVKADIPFLPKNALLRILVTKIKILKQNNIK